MLVKRLVAPQEPFTDDDAGSGYFATDLHYRRIAATICDRLSATSGFVMLTDETAPDGEMIAACLNVDTPAGFRATLVQCRPGMGFEEIVRLYSQQLGLAADDEGGNLWPLISHLMLESRKEIVRILVLENAEVLDDQAFDELYRFAKVDDPRLLPILLVAPASFAKRIEAPGLGFLKSAIVAHLSIHRLESDEVPAFIQFQMNAAESTDSGAFPAESVEAITMAANGDPGIVNCLAREALAFRRRRTATTQPGETGVVRWAEGLPQAPPPLEGFSVEPAPEIVLDELAALPHKDEGLPLSDQEEPATSEAEAATPVVDEPAEAMAPRLLETPPPKPRRVGMGLAAVAYLLVALVSASALLYLLVPSSVDKNAVSTIAEAIVPQAPSAGPEIPAEPSAAADTPDEASLEAIAKRIAPIEPSTAPPPAPAETAAAEPAPPKDMSATTEPTEPMAPPPAPAAETVVALLPAARPTPAAPPAEISPTPTPPAESAATPPPVSAAPPAPSAIAEASPPPTEPPSPPSAAPQPSSSSLPKASAVAAAAPSPRAAAEPAAPSSPPVRVANLEPSVAAPPRAVDRPPSAEIAVLIRRGDQLLAAGDIISARRFYERATAAGEASASLGLAKSYDPLYLQQSGARGVSGNPASAASWYRKAAEAGNAEASSLLGRLLARYPQ